MRRHVEHDRSSGAGRIEQQPVLVVEGEIEDRPVPDPLTGTYRGHRGRYIRRPDIQILASSARAILAAVDQELLRVGQVACR